MTPLNSPGLPDYLFVQGTGEAILNDEERWPQVLGKLSEPLASKVADRYNHYRTVLSALTTATDELLADHASLRLTTRCETDCRHCEIERHLEKVLARAASIGYRVLDDYY